MSADKEDLGLKAGIEVHNQLNTREKLFCGCSTQMRGEVPVGTVVRKQHPVASELGEYDVAAQYEVMRDRVFVYEAFRGETCQVEMDEEPPHMLNQEALETGIAVSLMLNCKIPDEVHVMRKAVIDGSNTTSFQRTMVVGMGGHMEYNGRRIPIDQVSLEEDASSIVGEEGGIVRYRLSRLGVPLIEIATGLLEGFSPKDVEDIAFEIGMVVRSTGKAKKNMGAIRQDLNVSVRGGARNELKGIQELGMLSVAMENEINRQISLISLADELKRRGLKKIHDDPVCVSDFLSGTENKILRSTLDSGGNIFSVVLPKFDGLLKRPLFEGKTLGREMADVAVAFGLKGLFHTDEDLSKYGLVEDFENLRRHLKVGKEDAIIVLGEGKTKGRVAKEIIERARILLKGPQEGTRSVSPDGSSRYNRPLPGSKRMYPETDIQPVPISEDLIEKIRQNLPELIPKKAARFKSQYKMSDSLVNEIMRSPHADIFEESIRRSGADASVVANTFVSVAKDLQRREGVDIGPVPDDLFFDMFGAVSKGMLAKEAIPEVLKYAAKHPEKSAAEIMGDLKLEMMTEKEIEEVVSKTMSEAESNPGKLVGIVMSKVRGKADPQLVIKTVKRLSEKR
ncbi:MAG: Glu-tRNA(Gln) amidotransferase subunit GatE [Candidatus Aenigmarchaeota archaeon]|nr:Glu-tRNA(Gln) amidotransferase subunit GatE [Candidatus Aenigmarchaeota archaeon]